MTNYDHLIGKVLEERYRLDAYIAGGGQANVWRVTDLQSGVPRAAKLFEARLNTPTQDIERFRKESLLLANLKEHPNVVQVHDGGFDNTLRAFYIIMELIDGVTLHEFIASRTKAEAATGRAPTTGAADGGDPPDEMTRMHEAENEDETSAHTSAHASSSAAAQPPPSFFDSSMAVAIISQAAQGLGHVHQYNIVHRDVKPGNILVGGDGVVKLTDFGIAQMTEDSRITDTDKAVGTLYYMSPEQILGHKADARTDIYSLGIVLYECLVGRTPFAQASRDMIPYHIINTPPIPPGQLNSEVPPSLEATVLRALSKTPDQRYRSMGEFEYDLTGLTNSGILSAVTREQISTGVLTIRGEHQSNGHEKPKVAPDSNVRCGACGAPLPVGWQTDLTQCPGCAGSLQNTVSRTSDKVIAFINQARTRRQFPPGKIAFDMAMFLYTMELQAPSFEDWKEKIGKAEPELQKGTVALPVPTIEKSRETDQITMARGLMEVADFLTAPELIDLNKRLSELNEARALAAHARAKAYQLLGRYHTLQGATAGEATASVKHYEDARVALSLAHDQYRLATDFWRQCEAHEPVERIRHYYGPVRDETVQRQVWTATAELLAQGILRFPHDRPEAYDLFRRAADASRELEPSPGVGLDLKLPEFYVNYYEDTLAKLEEHQKAIAAARTSARATIAEAQQADAGLLAADRKRLDEWIRERATVALDYFNKREDLPARLRRVRRIAWVVGYLLAAVLAVAFIGEARHGAYSVANPGPFWPGWPMVLSQSLRFGTNFGSWHHFLVMLAGIDLLLFWPFNLMAARRVPRAERSGPTRPVIPGLSQFLIPLVDALDGYIRRAAPPPAPPAETPPKTGEDATPAPSGNKFLPALARLFFSVAPWIPVLWLAWLLWRAFSGLAMPGNYVLWLGALFVLPAAGYFVGGAMRRLSVRLDRLDADEKNAHEALGLRALMDREKLQIERKRQADIVRDAFAQANSRHTDHRNTIVVMLQIFLARLLHHQRESDFVDLPGLDRALHQWREEIDAAFLRPMGLRYEEAEVRPVEDPEWRVERPLNTLHVTTQSRAIPLRFVYDRDAYLLWGVDGFQDCRRNRLQQGPDGYSLAVKLPSDTQQVNFMFETVDNRWPAEAHTIWIEGNRAG